MRDIATQLIEWIRGHAAPARRLVVPVSGGSDSALVFWAASQALPGKVTAIHAGNALRERAWFESVGPVTSVETPGVHAEREEMRWATFLAHANAAGGWLVGCRNRTEQELGTYSLASRVATFLPLVGTWKSDVMRACALAGVPEPILASSLRADPDCGRPQSLAEIPLEKIDTFLKVRLGELPSADLAALTAEQVAYLDGIYAANRFRATLPTCGPLIH